MTVSLATSVVALIVNVLPKTLKLPLILKSPVIVPPLFALRELLARINAAAAVFCAFVILVFCVLLTPASLLALAKAPLATVKAGSICGATLFAVLKAALA